MTKSRIHGNRVHLYKVQADTTESLRRGAQQGEQLTSEITTKSGRVANADNPRNYNVNVKSVSSPCRQIPR